MDLGSIEFAPSKTLAREGEAIWLRLVRGDSREPVRMLPADLADGVVSVGAADSCDWQIEAHDMPPVALFLKAIAGSLFVRPAGPAELHVDGQGVGSIWVPVERGARLAIGGALIEIGLAGRSREAQHALLQRVFDGPVGLDASLPAMQHPDLYPRLPDMRPDNAQDLADNEQDLAEASRADLDAYAPAQDLCAPAHDEPCAAAHDLYARVLDGYEPRGRACDADALAEQHWSATIFGADEAEDALAAEECCEPHAHRWSSTGLWIAGSLVACAYGCWVLLLDYF